MFWDKIRMENVLHCGICMYFCNVFFLLLVLIFTFCIGIASQSAVEIIYCIASYIYLVLYENRGCKTNSILNSEKWFKSLWGLYFLSCSQPVQWAILWNLIKFVLISMWHKDNGALMWAEMKVAWQLLV